MAPGTVNCKSIIIETHISYQPGGLVANDKRNAVTAVLRDGWVASIEAADGFKGIPEQFIAQDLEGVSKFIAALEKERDNFNSMRKACDVYYNRTKSGGD